MARSLEEPWPLASRSMNAGPTSAIASRFHSAISTIGHLPVGRRAAAEPTAGRETDVVICARSVVSGR